jgi:hypothetical protein
LSLTATVLFIKSFNRSSVSALKQYMLENNHPWLYNDSTGMHKLYLCYFFTIVVPTRILLTHVLLKQDINIVSRFNES